MDYLGKKPLMVINAQCSQLAGPLKETIDEAGLWAFQSFDLRTTRAVHDGCTCPNHGTSECTCELIVLLVYRALGNPISLILDGRDGMTYVFLNDEDGRIVHHATAEMIQRLVVQAATRIAVLPAAVDILSDQSTLGK